MGSVERLISALLKVEKAMSRCFVGVGPEVLLVEVSSSRSFFAGGDLKFAGVVAEDVSAGSQQFWQQTTPGVLLVHDGVLGTEEERVFAC